MAALIRTSSLHAHHSISMFDISIPFWVKGAVVSYAPVNPHAMIVLEERREDGQVQRWTIDGPTLNRLERMGADRNILKIGDVIEVCGFALKEGLTRRSSGDTESSSRPFVHGHVIVMPDGRIQPWGPYGKLDNCVRPGDRKEAWVELLDRDPMARQLWCNRPGRSIPTVPLSRALADAINSLMTAPCD